MKGKAGSAHLRKVVVVGGGLIMTRVGVRCSLDGVISPA